MSNIKLKIIRRAKKKWPMLKKDNISEKYLSASDLDLVDEDFKGATVNIFKE